MGKDEMDQTSLLENMVKLYYKSKHKAKKGKDKKRNIFDSVNALFKWNISSESKKGEEHPACVAKVPNKSFGQLLNISPKSFIFLKTFSSEFSYIEVWIADQNSKSLEIADKIKITLVID